MPTSETLNLITTINELQKLDFSQLNKLLEQMRVALKTVHEVMCLAELSEIIGLLRCLISSDRLDVLEAKLQLFDCYDIDKKNNNIARSLAIVRDPVSNELVLHILTNSKYYIPNENITSRYPRDSPLVRLGKGSFKNVKVCLRLEFKSGVFVVNPAARATVNIYNFGKLHRLGNPPNIPSLINTLSSSMSIADTLRALYACGLINHDLCDVLFGIYEEVRISKSLRDLPGVEQLAIGVPFLKQKRNGEYCLLTHVFSEKADGNLYEIKVPDTDLDSVIGQMLDITAQLHERGILHRDIKGANILRVMHNNSIKIKFIDFGASIDLNYLKKNTLQLLRQLRFNIDGFDGLVDGQLLIISDVLYALARLNHMIIPEEGNVYSQPTLKGINDRLAKYIEQSPNIAYMHLHATFGFDAPEVFADIHSLYQDDEKNYPSLGRDIYNKLSANARRYISNRVDHKQDVWALGISILYLYTRTLPKLSSKSKIAFIEANALLREMLHPDPNLRCDMIDALKNYRSKPILVFPELSAIALLAQGYESKISQYNISLERISNEFHRVNKIFSDVRLCLQLISNRPQDAVMQEIIHSLEMLNNEDVSKNNLAVKTMLLISMLRSLCYQRPIFYNKFGKEGFSAIVLLILEAGIEIPAFDLLCIVHIIMKDGLSTRLIDAAALLIDRCCPIIDSALTIRGVNIWDVPLESIHNIGGPKCAALSRYIETVIVAKPFGFIDFIASIQPKLFPQYAAIFIMDQRLHIALKSVTGANMFEHLAASHEKSGLCSSSDCFLKALEYKVTFEMQHDSNSNFTSYSQLAEAIIGSLTKDRVINNIYYYLLVLKYFAPHLYVINTFAERFKDAISDLRLQSANYDPIVQVLKERAAGSISSQQIGFKNYAKELLTNINPPRSLMSRHTM